MKHQTAYAESLTRYTQTMFDLSPIANVSTALSVPPSVLAVSASDLVSTRVTPVAVVAPLSTLAVTNDSRNAFVPAAEDANGATQATGDAQSENTPVSGPSSTYLTQLISQGGNTEDNQIALATSYARFAPANQYTTLAGYSIVRFRPSNAGLPSAYGSFTADTFPNVAESDYKAYKTTQSRNQSSLFGQEPHVTVAG